MPDRVINSGAASLPVKWKERADGTFSEIGAVEVVNPDGSSASSLTAGTNRSGSITTGGTAQQLAPANASRKMLSGQNISSADLWINEVGGTAAVDTAGSYRVAAGASFKVNTNQAVSVVGATAGQKFTATEV